MALCKVFSCRCDHCKHEWLSASVPQQCSRCKRRDWNVRESGGWVYVVGYGDSPLMKIGYTMNPSVRLASIRHPETKQRVSPILWIPSDHPDNLEAALHRHFAEKRTTGEWFNLSQSDLDWIKSAEFVHPGVLREPEWRSTVLTCKCHPPAWFTDGTHTIPSDEPKKIVALTSIPGVTVASALPRKIKGCKLQDDSFVPLEDV